MDERLLMLLIWGVGVVAGSGRVLRDRTFAWRRHRDERSFREFVSAIALFITSLAAAGAIAMVLFGEAGSGVRGFFVSLALGAFAGMVLSMAYDSWQEDRADRGLPPHERRHIRRRAENHDQAHRG